MPFYSYAFVLALASAALFWKAGEEEMDSGYLWGGLSVVVSALVIFVFGGGVILELFSQVALFFGIAIVRVWLDR